MEGAIGSRSSTLALLRLVSVSICCLMAANVIDAAVNFRSSACDGGHVFSPSEDQSFVEMLDKLLDETRKSFSDVSVSARDHDGRFEGSAGCLWHNCQIYDGECYACHSTRDATACIQTVIAGIKEGLRESNGYVGDRCRRSRKFATGEKSVAVDDASTTFQVCGVQYKYLGNMAMQRRFTF